MSAPATSVHKPPSPEYLSGEWVPIPEAIAWIIFRDFSKARDLRGAIPARIAVEYGVAKTEATTPISSPIDAQADLLGALRQGSVSALGRIGSDDLVPLGSERWAQMLFAERRDDPWCAICDPTRTLAVDLLMNAEMLIKAFPLLPAVVAPVATQEEATAGFDSKEERERKNIEALAAEMKRLSEAGDAEMTREKAARFLGMGGNSEAFRRRIWPRARVNAGLPEQGRSGRPRSVTEPPSK